MGKGKTSRNLVRYMRGWMETMIIWIVLGVVAALLLFWVMSVRCRHGHPAWEVLRRYRYAHRGLHDETRGIPENSLTAFRRAAERGYGAELDVHLTRDGSLVVIHDDSLLRTAGVDVDVSSLTAEQLSQYRLEGTQEKIPFLEEVLPLFEGRAPLIVELKAEKNAARLAKAACQVLDRYKVNYCIESFHPKVLMWLKRHRPEICRGQLSQNFIKERSGMPLVAAVVMTNVLTNLVTCPDFVAYKWKDRRRLSLFLARRLWRGQEVSWTIRDSASMQRVEQEGCLPIFEEFQP